MAELLGGLRSVNAPANFEASVNSRIKEQNMTSIFQRPAFLLGLKFALPLVALLFIGAILVFYNGRTVDEAAVPPAEGRGPDSTTDLNNGAPGPAQNAQSPTDDIARTNGRGQTTGSNRTPSNAVGGDANGGGSIDQGVSPADSPIYPKGLDPNRKITSPPPVPSGAGIPVESILSMVGIKPECRANGCLAVSVGKTTVAEKAGVKDGDLIEGVEDKPVKAGTVFEGTVSFRSIRVLRGGQRITINLAAR